MTFIKWLGMNVPIDVINRIFAAKTSDLKEGERDLGPVKESCKIIMEVFQEVLAGITGVEVPIGINVESLSIFREEVSNDATDTSPFRVGEGARQRSGR